MWSYPHSLPVSDTAYKVCSTAVSLHPILSIRRVRYVVLSKSVQKCFWSRIVCKAFSLHLIFNLTDYLWYGECRILDHSGNVPDYHLKVVLYPLCPVVSQNCWVRICPMSVVCGACIRRSGRRSSRGRGWCGVWLMDDSLLTNCMHVSESPMPFWFLLPFALDSIEKIS